MNFQLRHHHRPSQAADAADSTPNGVDDSSFGQTDPASTTWQAADAAIGFSGPVMSEGIGKSSAILSTTKSSPPNTSQSPIVTDNSPGPFVINVTYDSSVTDLDTVGNAAYNPTLYAEYTAAVQTAVQFYEQLISNSATIGITFSYGEIAGNSFGGAAGESEGFYDSFSYSSLYNAAAEILNSPTASAVQKAAFATLPTTDPTGGTGVFVVDTAEQKVLGLGDYTAGPDGDVGLSSSLPFSWTQPNTVSTNLDAVGVLEHEISEVMGRTAFLGQSNYYTLLDFFHYAAQGNSSNAAFGSAAGSLDEPFVSGYNSNTQSYFSYNGTTVTLPYDSPAEVAEGEDVADWTTSVNDDSYGDAIQGQTGLVSSTDELEMNVLGYDLNCFLPGTQISTPFGEVAVERLAIGDMVLTYRGEATPITWIGQGKSLATRGRRTATTPVVVHKGAIADNVPNRELRITKGHSLYIDEVLIPAEYLVNHRSITWDDRAQEVEVYHIELAVHDVLIANGTPTESYRDDGNRWLFQNVNSGWHRAAEAPCAPVLTGGPVVDAIWQRLLDRSGPRPGLPLTEDPDLHLLVDGNRIDGRMYPNGVFSCRVALPADNILIVSRAGAQDELGLSRDPRCLGVALRQIIVWQGRFPTLVSADDPRLSGGFHMYEADNDFRWTDGYAALPTSLFEGAHGVVDIDLRVGCTTKYPLLEDRSCAAA